ncbi:MAG: hypothetical protein P8R42_07845 [Candidatus Binatia bacterium]|nr:hypothetical protein [Candidatus Binatia bacterium]
MQKFARVGGTPVPELEAKNLTRLFLMHRHFDHTEGMEEAYAGVYILFHEAYSFDPKSNPCDAKAPVSAEHVQACHTSTEELAGILEKVKPTATVLYYYTEFTPLSVSDQEWGVRRSQSSVTKASWSSLRTGTSISRRSPHPFTAQGACDVRWKNPREQADPDE